jgi:hypothetical protein
VITVASDTRRKSAATFMAPRYRAHRNVSDCEGFVDKLIVPGFLIVATTLEATGDAIVRMGFNQEGVVSRAVLFLAETVLLFGYVLALNLAPIEFGRVIGIYIATLFVVWQIVNFVAFRSLPSLPTLAGARSFWSAVALSHSGNDDGTKFKLRRHHRRQTLAFLIECGQCLTLLYREAV